LDTILLHLNNQKDRAHYKRERTNDRLAAGQLKLYVKRSSNSACAAEELGGPNLGHQIITPADNYENLFF
jgi:hypothetical protein